MSIITMEKRFFPSMTSLYSPGNSLCSKRFKPVQKLQERGEGGPDSPPLTHTPLPSPQTPPPPHPSGQIVMFLHSLYLCSAALTDSKTLCKVSLNKSSEDENRCKWPPRPARHTRICYIHETNTSKVILEHYGSSFHH